MSLSRIVLPALFLATGLACGGDEASHDHAGHGAEVAGQERAHGVSDGEAPDEAAHDEPEQVADLGEGSGGDIEGWSTYGADFTLTGDAVPAGTVLGDPASYVGQTVLMQGEVADVCQKAGCWMVVTDGAKSMRVLMKDHDFSVAKDGTGATAQIEGTITAKEIDPETVAHFKSESARPEVMPEAGLPEGATTTYELVASAVRFKR